MSSIGDDSQNHVFMRPYPLEKSLRTGKYERKLIFWDIKLMFEKKLELISDDCWNWLSDTNHLKKGIYYTNYLISKICK